MAASNRCFRLPLNSILLKFAKLSPRGNFKNALFSKINSSRKLVFKMQPNYRQLSKRCYSEFRVLHHFHSFDKKPPVMGTFFVKQLWLLKNILHHGRLFTYLRSFCCFTKKCTPSRMIFELFEA